MTRCKTSPIHTLSADVVDLFGGVPSVWHMGESCGGEREGQRGLSS